MEITDNQKQILPQTLLAQIAEDLKTPLAQVARLSELARIESNSTSFSLESIRSISQSALDLVDGYALALRLANTEPSDLAVEPLSVGAIMANVTHEVESIAVSHGVVIKLGPTARYAPIVANRQALTLALANLGRSLIGIVNANEANQQMLYLGAKKIRDSIEIGWYWDGVSGINTEMLSRGRAIVGKSRQPLATVSSGISSGIFVSDYVLGKMDYSLQPSRLANLRGLAVRMRTSQQLALI